MNNNKKVLDGSGPTCLARTFCATVYPLQRLGRVYYKTNLCMLYQQSKLICSEKKETKTSIYF